MKLLKMVEWEISANIRQSGLVDTKKKRDEERDMAVTVSSGLGFLPLDLLFSET